MIGCGGIRAQHMSGIFDESDEIDVAAACEVSPEALERIQKRCGVESGRLDRRELFEADGIDEVSLAAASPSHSVCSCDTNLIRRPCPLGPAHYRWLPLSTAAKVFRNFCLRRHLCRKRRPGAKSGRFVGNWPDSDS